MSYNPIQRLLQEQHAWHLSLRRACTVHYDLSSDHGIGALRAARLLLSRAFIAYNGNVKARRPIPSPAFRKQSHGMHDMYGDLDDGSNAGDGLMKWPLLHCYFKLIIAIWTQPRRD